MTKNKMIIMTGNIGCGKSTMTSKIMSTNKNPINCANMDNIVTMMSGNNYSYKQFNKQIYRTIEETIIHESLKNNIDIIIDRTNMDLKRRKRFISIGKQYNTLIICYDFGKGTQNDLNRRLSNTKDTSIETWKRVFNKFQNEYVRPEPHEGFDHIIRVNNNLPPCSWTLCF